jgi:phosphoribosylglycinamide formyltransferase 1
MLKPHRPIRVAVLCSHRAPGLLYLLNRAPDRGVAYEVVCVVTSQQTFAEEVRVERRGIPTLAHPIREFYHARGASLYHDVLVREAYDAETFGIVEPYLPDLILLDGYQYLVTTPLLRTFARRIVNLHFGDLTLRLADGRPRFPGIRAVRDALASGCSETRATVHLVNEEAGGGPPIVRSWPFPVSRLVEDTRSPNAPEVFKAYTYAHQQWMMRTAAGPLMAATLRLVSTGTIDLDDLAGTGAAASSPWLLDQHGFLLAPEVALAEA